MAEVAIYARLVAARVRSEWQYRTAFALVGTITLVMTAMTFVGIAVMFRNVPQLAGWSLAEVAVLYATAELAFSLGDTFVSQVERTGFHIRAGSFDSFLIRPLHPMLQLCAQEFTYRRLTKLVAPLGVLIGGVASVDVSWSAPRVAALVMTVLCGALIFSGLWVAYCSTSFWFVGNAELVYTLVNGGQVASHYPLDVYSPWLRRWLTGVIPIGFVSYYPCSWILGHETGGMTSFVSPAVALTLVVIARTCWRTGIRHYRGTGS